MRYRISQLKMSPDQCAGTALEDVLEKAVLKKIRRAAKRTDRETRIQNLEIIRESIDARRKPDVKLVYTVDFDCDQRLPLEESHRETYTVPKLTAEQTARQKKRPVIVGFGPCGIFAALILAEAGLKPLVIERGRAMPQRVADVERFWSREEEAPDPESNVQFGEGGAGTFSDGKLTTGIKDIRIRKVLEEFVEAGADPKILYKQKPHIGTDKLREIVPKIRKKIEARGGEVRFSTHLDDIVLSGGRLTGIYANSELIETDHVILAVGHSARDTFEMLHKRGFRMEQKPFSIGVRIEHRQEMINESQYGDPKLAEILGPADYKLSYRNDAGRGVYTFCMCPGGEVVNASTDPGTSVTNGMSGSRRDGEYANSGLLVDVRTSDFAEACEDAAHPLAGIAFQKKYEELAWENRSSCGMARSTYGALRRKKDEDPVGRSLPGFAVGAILEAMPEFGRRIRGFDSDDARMTAVETRSSSPVRVLRDKSMQAEGYSGIIPAGEGPGYAGGIMSAAVDGIKAAERIITALE